MAKVIQCPECGYDGLEMAAKTGVAVCPTCSVRIILDRGGQVSSALWLKEIQENLIPPHLWEVISEEAEQAADALSEVPDVRTIWLWRGFVAYLGAVARQSSEPSSATSKLSEAAHCLESAAFSVDEAAIRLAQRLSAANYVARDEWIDWARKIIEVGAAIPGFGVESLTETRDIWYEIVLLMILEADPELDLDVALGVIPGGIPLRPDRVGQGGYISLAGSLPSSRLEPAKQYWPRIASRVPSAKRSLVMACVEMSDHYAIDDISIAPEFLELALDIAPSAVAPVVGTPEGYAYSGYWRLVFVAIHRRNVDLARSFFRRILEIDPDLKLSDSYFSRDAMDIREFWIVPDLGAALYACRADRAFSDNRTDDALAAVDQILKLLTIEQSSRMRLPSLEHLELEQKGRLGNLRHRWFRLDLPDELNEHAARLKDLLTRCADVMVDTGDYLMFAEYMSGRAGQGWDFEEQLRLACTYARAKRSYDWALKRAMLLAPERKAEIEKAARSAGISWLVFQGCWLTRQSEAGRVEAG